MRIIKIDDEEIEICAIKHVDGKKFRIPIQVDENEQLNKSRIPDEVIMVRSYSSGDNKYFVGLWNKEYEFKHRSYVETAKSIDELLPKLEKYGCYVYNWEDGKRLL